jgi:hypothetical protein
MISFENKDKVFLFVYTNKVEKFFYLFKDKNSLMKESEKGAFQIVAP